MNKDEIKNNKQGIKDTFNSLFMNVDNLISELKQKSSEEVLNGSVVEAQKLMQQILPYQKFYEKLLQAQMALGSIGRVSKEDIELAKENIETFSQEQIDKEVEESNSNNNDNPPINYRIPILKALIFLGGSSEETEVIEFLEKEMKNKFTEEDFEIHEGEQRKRWISNMYFETSNMTDEGLLSNEAPKNSWEICQKGIDYLSKYAK